MEVKKLSMDQMQQVEGGFDLFGCINAGGHALLFFITGHWTRMGLYDAFASAMLLCFDVSLP